MSSPPKPLCFSTEQQWAAWLETAAIGDARPGPDSYCLDCSPQYQSEMIQLSRCQYPTVSFIHSWGEKYDRNTKSGHPPLKCDGRRQGPIRTIEFATAELGFCAKKR